MSREVDERVVQMQFDNAQFERETKRSLNTIEKLKTSLNFDKSKNYFDGINKSASKVNLTPVGDQVDGLRLRFSTLDTIAITVISDITRKVEHLGLAVTKAFTIDPVKTGLAEYETQINSVQTILANTQSKGTTLEQVNAALDELNRYADMTIYNFTEMTRNIGTFTAAGVGLETSVQAIKGIANLAAVSGSTSQQASTAMYQLSQALAAGTVKLMDWNSVVNAGMGGQVFQDALKETARVHGIAIDEMIAKEGSFRETLSKGWLTSSILTETLAKFTGDLSEEELRAIGYTEEQIEAIIKMGETASDAATKVKTFTQLIDTLKEAVQSGWSQSWEYIIGDFEESKELWTEISDRLSEIVNKSAEARNALLKGGLASGWKQFLGEGIEDSSALFTDMIAEIGKAQGILTDEEIEKAGGLEKTFSSGWLDKDTLVSGLKQVIAEANAISAKSDEELENLKISRDSVNSLLESYTSLLESIEKGDLSVDEFIKKIERPSGRENLFQSLLNVMDAIGSVISPLKNAFNEIFPPMTSETLYNITVSVEEFTRSLILSEDTVDKLTRTFKGFFSIFKIGFTGIKKLGSGVNTIFTSIFKSASPVGGVFLQITAAIGDFITTVANALESGKSLSESINLAKKSFSNAIAPVSEFVDKLNSVKSSLFGSSTFKTLSVNIDKVTTSLKKFGISDVAIASVTDLIGTLSSGGNSSVSTFGQVLETAFTLGVEALTNFKNVSAAVLAGIASLPVLAATAFKNFADGVANGLEKAKKAINSALSPFDFFFESVKKQLSDISDLDIYRILSLLDVGFLAYMIGNLAKAMNNVGGLFKDPITKMLNSISGAFNSISSAAKTWEKQQTAESIQHIAVSILALAGALYVISKIETKSLIAGVIAIAAMTATMVIAVKALRGSLKEIASGKLVALSVTILAIAGSMTFFADAITKLMASLTKVDAVNTLDSNAIAFAVIITSLTVMMAAITKFASTMSAVSAGTLLSMALVITSFGVALNIIADAINKLAPLMSQETIGKAIGSIISVLVMMASVGAVMHFANFTGLGMSSGLALIGFATSLYILVEAISKLVSLKDIDVISSGIDQMVGLMIGLSVLAAASSRLYFGSGMAFVAMASSILILYKAIELYSEFNPKKFEDGIRRVGACLAALTIAAVGLSLNFGGILSASVGLVIISGALYSMSLALENLASILNPKKLILSFEVLKRTLYIIVGSLVTLTFLGPALATTASALLTLSFAMTVFTASIAVLSSLDPVGIAIGIGAILGILASISIAGAAITAFPILAAGITTLGVALAGLSSVFLSFAAAAGALALASAAIGVLAMFAGPVSKAIVGAAPDIQEALITLITVIANVVTETINPVLDAIGAVLMAIGVRLYEGLLILGPIAVDALKTAWEYIKSKASDFFWDHDYFGFSFLNPSNWADLFGEGLEGIQDNWNKLWLPDYQTFNDSGKEVASGLADGIESGKSEVEQSASELGSLPDEVIRREMEINSPSKVAIADGEYVAEGYAQGIQNGKSKVTEAIKDLAIAGDTTFREYWEINSPAKKSMTHGEYIAEGYALGMLSGVIPVSAAGLALYESATLGLTNYNRQTAFYDSARFMTEDLANALGKAAQDKNVLVDAESAGSKIYEAFGNGLTSGTDAEKLLDNLAQGATDVVTDIGNTVSGFFGLGDSGLVANYLKQAEESINEIGNGITSGAETEQTAAEKIEDAYKTKLEANKLLREASEAEYELWLAENQNGASSDELLAKKLEYTATEIENQTDRVAIAQAKYDEMLKTLGKDATETKEAYVDLLDEKNTLANLKADRLNDLYSEELERLGIESEQLDKEYELWTSQNNSASDATKTNEKVEYYTSKLAISAKELTAAQSQYEVMLAEFGESDLRTKEAYNEYLQAQIDYQNLANSLTAAQLESFDNALAIIDRESSLYSQRASILSKIYDDGDLSSRADDYLNAVETYGAASEEARRAKYQGTASSVLGVATALKNMSYQLNRTSVYQKKYDKLLASNSTSAEDLAAAQSQILSSSSSFIDYAEDLAEAFNMDEEGKSITLRLAYAISDNWKNISVGLEDAWSKVKERIPELATKVEDAFGVVFSDTGIEIGTSLVSTIVSAMSGDIGGALISGLNTVLSFASSEIGQTVIANFGSVLSSVVPEIIGTITSFIGSSGSLSSIGSTIMGVVGSITSSGGLLAGLEGVGTAIMGLVASVPELLPIIAIIGAIAGLGGLLIANWEDVGEFFSNLWNGMIEIASNLFDGLIEGIKSAWHGFTSFIEGIFGGIIDIVKGIFGINSPSVEFFKIGEFIDQGFINGINSSAKNVGKSISDMTSSALETARMMNNSLYDAVNSGPSLGPTITPVIDLSSAKDSTNWLRSSLSGMDGTVNLEATRSANLAVEASIPKNQNGKVNQDSSRSDVVRAIATLSDKVAMMGESIEHMQIVMDSGKLVGSILPKMDSALGTRIARTKRGG